MEQKGDRIGEIALLKQDADFTFGRSDEPATPPRVNFGKRRPGAIDQARPIEEDAISRKQGVLRSRADGVIFEITGKCPTFVNGRKVSGRIVLKAGDVIAFKGQMVLLLLRRPRALPAFERFSPKYLGAFGEPNAFGFVGESWCMYRFFDVLAEAAAMHAHVLVRGDTGTGKELAAHALHVLSPRASGPFVSHSAANIPDTLASSIFGGGAKNYPNFGQPERPGLFGAADGGTLFLDEIAKLSHGAQGELLRVLDSGEHTRLGETKPRRSNFVLVAATNRPSASLLHDFRRRFRVEVEVPSLEDRPEDIPLLVRHIIRRAADNGNQVAIEWASREVPARVIERLMYRKYPGNIRELEETLWKGLRSAEALLEMPEVEESVDPSSITAEEVQGALDRAKGNKSEAARLLRVSPGWFRSLLKKHGISSKK